MTTTSTTTSLLRSIRGLRACVACMLLACPALARISEPCNIYYGEARDPDGRVMTSGTIVVSINGMVCAREEIRRQLADTVNYSVRVPLDDGMDLRYVPNAARLGEQVAITVVSGGQEYDVSGDVPAAAIAGTTQRADIQTIPEPAGIAAALVLALLARRARD